MMRKSLLALTLAILAALPVWASEWPKKMFETTTHDFGKIARGAKAE